MEIGLFRFPRPLDGKTVVRGNKDIGDFETAPISETLENLLKMAIRSFPDFVGDVEKFEVVLENVGR